jgi:hypothetical protein
MDLAKRNILFGGTARYSGGVTTQKTGNESYEFGESGFVPMPGINDITVKSLNRGAIRKATISITAHNKQQFEIINLLYLHLGYTVMLEWGNAFFLDNSSKLQKVGNTLIENMFFSKNKNGSYADILPLLNAYKEKYHFNYDGMLGKISNYSWSFKKDGSYDIELNLISMGDVVESLKTNISIDKSLSSFLEEFNTNQETTGAPPAIESNKNESLLSSYLFLYQFIDNEDTKNNVTRPDITVNNGDKIGVFLNNGSSNLTVNSKTYKFYRYDTGGLNRNDDGVKTFNSVNPERDALDELYNRYNSFSTSGNKTPKDQYTTQGNLFIYSDKGELVETITTPVVAMEEDSTTSTSTATIANPIDNDPPNVAIKINATTPQYYIKMDYILKFLKNKIIPNIKATPSVPLVDLITNSSVNIMYRIGDIHVSLDPRVCIVRNDGFRELDTGGNIVTSKAYPELDAWSDSSNKNKAYLNNIYLNFAFVINCLESSQDEKGNSSLFQFLSSICDGLNKALGGVNNLEPTIDEPSNSIRIIDSTPIPNTSYKRTGDDIILFGYEGNTKSNFVRKLDIKTTIPPQMATMVSVGATSGGYVKGVEATAFAKWNKNINDRFKVDYVPPNMSSSIDSEKEVEENYLENFVQNDAGAYGLDAIAEPRTFTDSVITKNISTVTEYYRYTFSQNKNSGGSIGFIPFKISFTMDGISGFKIYNKIRLNLKFLSKDYQNFLNFVITEINDKIADQDWETEISAIIHPETQNISPSIKRAKQIVNIARTPPSLPGGTSAVIADGPAVTGGDADFWTLLAICAFEDGDPQGRADVAQSIYNRVAAGPGGGYGALSTSIAGVIKSNAQYEPAFNRSNGGPNNMETHPNWKAISDKASAIRAVRGYKPSAYPTDQDALNLLKQVYNVLKDPALQQESRNFIGPRTDFLSITMGDVASRNASTGSGTSSRITFVMRNTGTPNNVFGFAYNYTGANGTALPPPPAFWDRYLSQL